MPKYIVLVDTIEIHTRRYTVEAETEDRACTLVLDEELEETLDYTDSFEGLSCVDDSFNVIDVTEQEPIKPFVIRSKLNANR